MSKEIRKIKPLYRDVSFDQGAVNQDARTVELAFSSEEPYLRYDGFEILDHDPKSIRLGRLSIGGPLLVNHDTDDVVGITETIEIGADRRGRAVARFGKSARAEEIFQDVIDGIRKSVSVGYRVYKAEVETRADEGPDTYRVTDWEPLEISLVSVPADSSVGIGRGDESAAENDFLIVRKDKPKPKKRVKIMSEKKIEPTETPVDIAAIQRDAAESIKSRNTEVLDAGKAVGMQDLAAQVVRDGGDINGFNQAYIKHMQSAKPIPSAEIDLTEKEVKQFSFLRAINALTNPTNRQAQEAAAFELECSRAAASKTGKEAQGILVPIDVLKRDLNVTTATAGGHTVSTDLLAASFIEMLTAQALMLQNATVLTGLVGNVAIPRQTGGATAYWVAESVAITESAAAFDQVTLSPETVGAFSDYSRKLMLQSSLSVEAFVRGDLARSLALEIDRVAINGSGSGAEPEGILNVTGIGDVAGGTNGLAPAWSHVVDLETEVATDNADLGNLAYLTNAPVRGALKQTEKASSTGQFIWGAGGELNGYRALTTNQVPSDLDKGTSTGVCSAIIFGNFADLLIGMWGGLDLNVDTSTGSTTGVVRVVAMQDIDLAVRHAESFAAMQDALTA